jgi:hypothetical protein
MAFLYPAFLLGGLAIALPIVLHLLRRHVAPEVPFTAVRLLQKSPVERAERRRLRELILLAARIAALLLLATAFARPYMRGAAPPPLRIVDVDRSFSLGAPGVFDRARELARAATAHASSAERVAVVAFDDRAEVVAPPGPAADAGRAVEGLQAGFGATRYGPVFQLAADLAGGAAGRLVIVSDLQRGGWDAESLAALPPGWELELEDARDSESHNLAVTAASVEPDRVVASLQYSGADATSGRVRAFVDGKEAAAADFRVAPRGTVEVSIPWRVPTSGGLRVAVDDPGGLPADDARFVALGSMAASPLVITSGDGAAGSPSAKPAAFYLSRALGTTAGTVDVAPASRLAGMSLDDVTSRRGVALLSTRGLDRAGRERLMAFVSAGGGLFLAAGPDLEIPVLAEMTGWQPPLAAVEQPGPLTLAPTDLRHPVFQPFGAVLANLAQVRFERAWRVDPQGWTVIARFSNGTPALVERAMGKGRVVLLASDVDRRWNDFPLHPAFVPFALETLRYVAGSRAAHDYLVAEAPAEARHTPGVYRAADGRPFAVNVDIRESALEAMTADEFSRQVQRPAAGAGPAAVEQARQTEAHQSYWQYGLALMIATLVAESVAGRA